MKDIPTLIGILIIIGIGYVLFGTVKLCKNISHNLTGKKLEEKNLCTSFE